MNENDGTVSLRIPESMAISLIGVLGHCLTSEVCDDLGLNSLYSSLTDKLGRVDVEAMNGLIRRDSRDIPVSVTVRSNPRYTSIDLT